MQARHKHPLRAPSWLSGLEEKHPENFFIVAGHLSHIALEVTRLRYVTFFRTIFPSIAFSVLDKRLMLNSQSFPKITKQL